MSTTAIRSKDATTDARVGKVDMKLEVEIIPVSDVDRSKEFYAHLGWRPMKNLEFSIGGQNLLDNQHLEFLPDFVNTSPTVVKRSIFGSITVKF